jgi:Tol biopolymer transport system component
VECGGAQELLPVSPRAYYEVGAGQRTPRGWTPDRTALIVEVEAAPDTNADIGLVSLEGPGTWEPLIHSEADEVFPSLSPDGSWIAYASDDSVRYEVYVQRFPASVDDV